MADKHKVFISFHSLDMFYKQRFETLFSNYYDVMISKAVSEGDISNMIQTETVRQKIRDEYLRDSTVTVVLVGQNTWQRKHVDWEIGSSIRETQFNSRSGLLGIILPTYPLFSQGKFDHHTIPPRLSNNITRGYSEIYRWNENPVIVQKWIHDAYLKRTSITPDNSYPYFVNNRSGDRWQ